MGLAATSSIEELWLFVLMMGSYYGLTESAGRSLIRDLATGGQHGTALGWYHLVNGVAAILGGAGLGGIWSLYGSALAFCMSACTAGLCGLLAIFVLRKSVMSAC